MNLQLKISNIYTISNEYKKQPNSISYSYIKLLILITIVLNDQGTSTNQVNHFNAANQFVAGEENSIEEVFLKQGSTEASVNRGLNVNEISL